jgi:formylglycine-generating enzyme required for sulfatase activity
MVVIPAGNFMMGSPEGEAGRETNEGPQHQVTITKAFALGKFEVTVGEFAAFVAATNYTASNACPLWNAAKTKTETAQGTGWRNHRIQCARRTHRGRRLFRCIDVWRARGAVGCGQTVCNATVGFECCFCAHPEFIL